MSRFQRDKVQVHQVPEVEAVSFGRGVPLSAGGAAELVSATTSTNAGSTMWVTSRHISAHQRT